MVGLEPRLVFAGVDLDGAVALEDTTVVDAWWRIQHALQGEVYYFGSGMVVSARYDSAKYKA